VICWIPPCIGRMRHVDKKLLSPLLTDPKNALLWRESKR
jgi:hypothetical protein